MKASFCASAVLLLLLATFAQAQRTSIVYFTHPTAATGKTFTFLTDDPHFHVDYGPNKCLQPFLGGSFMGMPDPRIKNPKEVCGWGKAYFAGTVGHPLFGHTGPAPASLIPIEAPMPVEAGGAAVDAAALIREMLPKIDKSDGDRVPVVIHIRNTIRSLDILHSFKNSPKRYAQK